MSVTDALPEGTIVGEKYEIQGLIGRGATGHVYRARDVTRPGSCWAIKEIIAVSGDKEEEGDYFEHFRQEALLLLNLSHPSIIRVIHTFSMRNRHYLVTEFIEGKNLQEIFDDRGRPFTFHEIRQWLIQLLGILEYLHHQPKPVIFRDLKPSNIMITADSRVKLIDFGIARVFVPLKNRDTDIIGTAGFSSPEQYGSGQSDPRSDLYSWAVTAYYLLTDKEPESFAFNFPVVTTFNTTVPPWFSAILSRCLEREPEKRFSSAMEIKELIGKSAAPMPLADCDQSLPHSPSMVNLGAMFIVLAIVAVFSLLLACYFPAEQGTGVIEFFVLAIGLVFFSVYNAIFKREAAALLPYFMTGGSAWKKHILLFCQKLTLFLRLLPIAALAVLILRFQWALSSGSYSAAPDYHACRGNEVELAGHVKRYARAHGGSLPPRLSRMIPTLISAIPTCPAAGRDTYSDGYRVNETSGVFTICCSGHHHEKYSSRKNHPVFTGILKYP